MRLSPTTIPSFHASPTGACWAPAQVAFQARIGDGRQWSVGAPVRGPHIVRGLRVAKRPGPFAVFGRKWKERTPGMTAPLHETGIQ